MSIGTDVSSLGVVLSLLVKIWGMWIVSGSGMGSSGCSSVFRRSEVVCVETSCEPAWSASTPTLLVGRGAA